MFEDRGDVAGGRELRELDDGLKIYLASELCLCGFHWLVRSSLAGHADWQPTFYGLSLCVGPHELGSRKYFQ